MSNPKTEITGEVAKCDIKKSKAGKQFAEIHILAMNKKHDGTNEEVVYPMTAFSFHAKKFSVLKEGDYVCVTCSVTMDTFKPEWPKVKLIVDSIDVQHNVVAPEKVAKSVASESSEGFEPDTYSPF